MFHNVQYIWSFCVPYVDINGEFKVNRNSITTPDNIWFDPSINVAANVLQSSDVLGCLMQPTP